MQKNLSNLDFQKEKNILDKMFILRGIQGMRKGDIKKKRINGIKKKKKKKKKLQKRIRFSRERKSMVQILKELKMDSKI